MRVLKDLNRLHVSGVLLILFVKNMREAGGLEERGVEHRLSVALFTSAEKWLVGEAKTTEKRVGG